MGLYVSFTPEQLGYPLTLEQELLGQVAMVEIDYGPACEAFVSTFYDMATSLVPVDTGYLQSTIDADTDGFFCEAMADAEYAQYVEYGTWKMSAQPYFTPAVEAGLEAFQAVAEEAVDEAQQELQAICEDIMAAAQEAFMAEYGEGFMSELGGTLFGGLMLLLLFPVLVNLYGILDSINPNSYNDNSLISGIGGMAVNVIIT